jgi:hypothetical protein
MDILLRTCKLLMAGKCRAVAPRRDVGEREREREREREQRVEVRYLPTNPRYMINDL